MNLTSIDLLIETGPQSGLGERVQTALQDAGLFGMVMVPSRTDASALEATLVGVDDDGAIALARTTPSGVVLDHHLEALLGTLSLQLNAHLTLCPQTGEEITQSHTVDQPQTPTPAYDAYLIRGKYRTLDALGAELAREFSNPTYVHTTQQQAIAITAAEHQQPTFLAGYLPVIHLIAGSNPGFAWYPKSGGTTRMRALGVSHAEFTWYAPDLPVAIQPPAAEVAYTQAYQHQTQLLSEMEAELATITTSAQEEVSKIAAELNLSPAEDSRLQALIADPAPHHALPELAKIFGLPRAAAHVVEGRTQPHNHPEFTHHEPRGMLGTIGESFLTKPTGNRLYDRWRRLDWERPHLALLIIVASFILAGGAAFLALSPDVSLNSSGWKILFWVCFAVLIVEAAGNLLVFMAIQQRKRQAKE